MLVKRTVNILFRELKLNSAEKVPTNDQQLVVFQRFAFYFKWHLSGMGFRKSNYFTIYKITSHFLQTISNRILVIFNCDPCTFTLSSIISIILNLTNAHNTAYVGHISWLKR